MREIRNSMDKLVCMIDEKSKTIEIVIKGCKTTIQFLDNNSVKVINANKIA